MKAFPQRHRFGERTNRVAFPVRQLQGMAQVTQKIGPGTLFGVVLATIGMYLLCVSGSFTIAKGDLLVPELSGSYLDRSWVRPGMILEGGVVVDAFDAIGWGWGGRWADPLDLTHFSLEGI